VGAALYDSLMGMRLPARMLARMLNTIGAGMPSDRRSLDGVDGSGQPSGVFFIARRPIRPMRLAKQKK